MQQLNSVVQNDLAQLLHSFKWRAVQVASLWRPELNETSVYQQWRQVNCAAEELDHRDPGAAVCTCCHCLGL